MFWESREASTRVDRGKRTVESVGEGTWQGSGKGGVGSRATPSFPAGVRCGGRWESWVRSILCDLGSHSSPKVALMRHPASMSWWLARIGLSLEFCFQLHLWGWEVFLGWRPHPRGKWPTFLRSRPHPAQGPPFPPQHEAGTENCGTAGSTQSWLPALRCTAWAKKTYCVPEATAEYHKPATHPPWPCAQLLITFP